MCGIVGLFALDDAVCSRMGELFTPMLRAMTERGPDSAGIAVYRQAANGQRKYSLYEPSSDFDWDALASRLDQALPCDTSLSVRSRYAILSCDKSISAVPECLREAYPTVRVMGMGEQMEIYKDVGAPGEVADRYGIASMSATCMIGHTRMATESAVNVEGSHPYASGEDLCLVHNGSLANHNTLRRVMMRDGISFESWNDTEVAARYLEWRLSNDETLEEILKKLSQVFSGFFTLTIGLKDHFAVIRDPYACKPMVVAETDDYVACGSEFRALAHLPGIMGARIFEPKPEGVYVWSR